MAKLFTIFTPLVTIIFIALFICPSTAGISETPRDVIPRRRIKRSSMALRQRAPIYTLRRRDPVNLDRAPAWATKLPGDFSNSIGRETELGAEFAGCVTLPNDASPSFNGTLHSFNGTLPSSNGTPPPSDNNLPTYSDILEANRQLDYRGNQTCVPPQGLGNQDEHHCGPLTTLGTATIYFCGAPGKFVPCSSIASAVLAFNAVCVQREDDHFTERGSIAILPEGYPEDISHLSFIVIDSPGLLDDV
ncbi:uncharacterized protein LAJ45_05287 [Morchella importuna]|uniref:uncharacterized protein n=1 Tax=Morchella importuna TaxID=1174673 RepID=UPI001E8EB429|nr:uncharacterized protein LAJ45_05287 [Morchella importuna]KAH8150591.1 hypothetical protein LAJ45_05287 [Morchella importuna]